jgi:glycosyltransferase involved in cell wall biosynthesis
MKVLHVRETSNIYGAETVILTLVKEQMKNGVEVGVVCLERSGKDSFSKRLKSMNVPVYKIISKGKIDFKALIELKRVCDEFKPHIIHSHGYKSDFFLAILKKIQTKRSILISTKHGWTGAHWRTKLYEIIDDFILRYFDGVVAVSNHIYLHLIKKGIPPSKIKVIHNGISLAAFNNGFIKFKLRKELGLDNQSKLIGFIGRLSPEKGILYLLKVAMAMHRAKKNLYFVLVGDGPLRKEVEHYVNINGLNNRVFVLGRREDIEEILSDLDMVVLPSIREGTPMILLEAMAMGKAIVATEVGGVKDIVKNLETGLLVRPYSCEALIDAITYLLENESFREEIGRRAFEVVKSRFSSEIMTKSYLDMYNELLRYLDLN